MSPHLAKSVHEESARALKVERLTSFLASHIDLSADDAGAMIEGLSHRDLKWWRAIAAGCSRDIGHKVNAPSATSIQHIQAELRKRIPSDVFERLARSYRADADAEVRGIGGQFS